MRKIQLQLESLVVESFHTTAPAQAQGTVVGHQFETRGGCSFSCPESCIQTACTCPDFTCAESCNGSCLISCGGTCLNSCGCATLMCPLDTYEATCRCTGRCTVLC